MTYVNFCGNPKLDKNDLRSDTDIYVENKANYPHKKNCSCQKYKSTYTYTYIHTYQSLFFKVIVSL